MNKYNTETINLKEEIKLIDDMYIVRIEKLIPVGIHCFPVHDLYNIYVCYKKFVFGREKKYITRVKGGGGFLKRLRSKILESILLEGFMAREEISCE